MNNREMSIRIIRQTNISFSFSVHLKIYIYAKIIVKKLSHDRLENIKNTITNTLYESLKEITHIHCIKPRRKRIEKLKYIVKYSERALPIKYPYVLQMINFSKSM